jgi:hypothetical protein
MRETPAEAEALQRLLDRSRGQAADHPRRIIDDRRAFSAAVFRHHEDALDVCG